MPAGGITVKELLALCQNAIEKGHGDKVVQITKDDEGNGYHTLYYGFDVDMHNMPYALHKIHDNHGEIIYNEKNAILLG